MRFEWDKNKNIRNIAKHGISFENAIKLFLDDHITFELDTVAEKRFAAVGKVDGNFCTAIFVQRKSVIRIISVRRSRKDEEKIYGKYH